MFRLAPGGEKGVEHALKSVIGKLKLTLHLSGTLSVDKNHLNRSVMIKEDDLYKWGKRD
jgi:lactate 2-monooxygenase